MTAKILPWRAGPPTPHGTVIPWPEESWGPRPATATCDWGDCDRLATCARYDNPPDGSGVGWLPCCGTCAQLPVEPLG